MKSINITFILIILIFNLFYFFKIIFQINYIIIYSNLIYNFCFTLIFFIIINKMYKIFSKFIIIFLEFINLIELFFIVFNFDLILRILMSYYHNSKFYLNF